MGNEKMISGFQNGPSMPFMWKYNSIYEKLRSQFCHKVLRAANGSSKLLWKQGAGAKRPLKITWMSHLKFGRPWNCGACGRTFSLGTIHRCANPPPRSLCETVNDEGSLLVRSLRSPPPLSAPSAMDKLFCKWPWRRARVLQPGSRGHWRTNRCRTPGEDWIDQKHRVQGLTPVAGGDGNTD